MEDCDICFKIICKKCGWTASKDETQKIASGRLTTCPVCNWSPSSESLLL